jgi:DNA-binding transcriptional LysR family regulator
VKSLNWDLDVLSRAIGYPNLSAAAAVIGISQPQLSRIIKKLEDDTGISLLDRASRRSSGWTSDASKLADAYQRALRDFNLSLIQVRQNIWRSHVRVGSLDGMSVEALSLCQRILDHESVESVELNIYDLPDLEERFLNQKLDLIFSLREPGKSKLYRTRLLGYQTIEEHGAAGGIQVRSLFEHTTTHGARATRARKSPDDTKVLVSNSMAIREKWIRTFAGHGTLPSPIKPKKTNRGLEYPALLIAQADMPDFLWNQILEPLKTRSRRP